MTVSLAGIQLYCTLTVLPNQQTLAIVNECSRGIVKQLVKEVHAYDHGFLSICPLPNLGTGKCDTRQMLFN